MDHPPDPCDHVLIALRRIIRAIELHSRQLVQRHGLTGPQILILKEVLDAGRLTIGELAQRASVSQATVTVLVDRLEVRGYVQRARSDADRRRVLVTASDAGRAVLAGSPSLLQDAFVRRFRALEPAEQAHIVATLQRVAGMMDAGDIDVAPMLSGGILTADVADGGPPLAASEATGRR